MNPAMPSVWRAAVLAWRDLLRALVAMPVLAAITAVIVAALGLIEILVAPTMIGSPALSFVTSLTQALVLTPYLIAVHRLIILGEVTEGYVLKPRQRRFQRFCGSWIVLLLISFLPLLLVHALALPIALQAALLWIMVPVIMVIGLRITILFPAVAVDAPGATWRNAMADTKGRAVRIFAVGLVAILPLVPVGAIVFYLAGAPASATTAGKVLGIGGTGVLSTMMIVLLVVVASRFYQWLGDRVGRPASA